MKLTVFLFFVALLSARAEGRAQTVSISGKDMPLKEIFNAVEKQTGYVVLSNKELLAGTKTVTLSVFNLPLQELLTLVLKDQQMDYTIMDKTIFLSKKIKAPSPAPALPWAQPVFLPVKGRLMAADGTSLPGVNIKVRGTDKGTVSAANGSFTIEVNEGEILDFTFIGFAPLSARLTDNKFQLLPSGAPAIDGKQAAPAGMVLSGNPGSLLIRMVQSTSPLDEVQVIAYGTTSRRLATGNVTKVSGEELAKQPVVDPLAALMGRVPGMEVSQVSGVPGARINVQVRGRANFDNSYSSDQPLFILDGVPMAAGNDRMNANTGPFGSLLTDGLSPFAGLNPSDIESIEVLKDADATAIYGSRGANGVILITTKKGKTGKMKTTASVYSGISTVTTLPKMMNTQQYLEMRNEAFKNDNITKTNANAYDLLLWDQDRYTDFAKLLVGNQAPTNDAQLTLSGGTRNVQYRLGGGYHKEGTVWPGNKSSDRASLNFSLRSTSQDEKFTVDLSGLYSVSKSDLVAGDLAGAITLPPNYRLYDDEGNLAWNEGGFVDGKDNPMASFLQQYKSVMNSVNSSLMLNYKITPDLTVRSSFGYNASLADDKRLMPLGSQNPGKSISGVSSFGNKSARSWIVEPQVEYHRNISRGKLNVLLGATYSNRSSSSMTTRGTGYTSDDLLESLEAAATITATNKASQYNYQAFFGRLNYNWEDKYIVNFTGRRDGSSRFGPEFRFSNFGAVGAAWVFSNESFFKNNSAISFGKLRASYGVTGNDQIGEYSYLDKYISGSLYGGEATLIPGSLFSPMLHWERNIKSEVAVELGFLRDRVLFSAAVFRNISSDPLVSYPLPAMTGFGFVVNNLAGVRVENRGLELTLGTKNFQNDNFRWNTDFNLTIPKNILRRYPNLEYSSYAKQYAIGHSLNGWFGGQYLGVDPETGLYTVKDANGDNKMNGDDFAMGGHTDPKYFGGMNNTFSYKRFSASFFLQFTSKLERDWKVANTLKMPGTLFNFPVLALDRWQTPGQQSATQKYTTRDGALDGLTGTYAYYFSNGQLTDASFLRLKNVYLAYDLPAEWLRAIRISTCRLYLQAQNLFVISGYEGGDPEVHNYTRMAPLRTITGGIQLSL